MSFAGRMTTDFLISKIARQVFVRLLLNIRLCDLFLFQLWKFHSDFTRHLLPGRLERVLNPNDARNSKKRASPARPAERAMQGPAPACLAWICAALMGRDCWNDCSQQLLANLSFGMILYMVLIESLGVHKGTQQWEELVAFWTHRLVA